MLPVRIIKTRETREGWPLLTVENEVNGDSKSRNKRAPSCPATWPRQGATLLQGASLRHQKIAEHRHVPKHEDHADEHPDIQDRDVGHLWHVLPALRIDKFAHLKGSVTRFFASGFFRESPSPKPLIITLGSFRIFPSIRGDIHKSKCTTGVNDTGGKFANGVNDTGGKFFHQFPLCCWHRWQICHRCQRHRRQICHRCHWHRWQIIGTISGFRHRKVNLKAKIHTYVSSTTQRWPKKIIKIFLIEDFFHLPPVSLTPVANLELPISLRNFEKIRNDLYGILWGWGETESWKEPEAKNLVTLSL